MSVLVVEDEALIRIAAVDLVESLGLEAVEAANADEAIIILDRRRDIRLVLTDVDMPGSMDGLRLAHYIAHRWPPIRLIVVSGKAVVAESQLPKGTGFLSKPYAEHEVTNAIKSMLQIG